MGLIKKSFAVLALYSIISLTNGASIESSIAVEIDENGLEKTYFDLIEFFENKNGNDTEFEARQGGLCVGETNAARRSNGKNSNFQHNNQLAQAAKNHNDHMIRNNCFSHRCSGEKDLGGRVSDTGYRWRSIGENIAAGQSNCQEVVNGWMNSSGHRANILSDQVHIGCATGTCNNCQYRTYWTCVYGKN